MEPTPNPGKAVTKVVESKQEESGKKLSAEDVARLRAMLMAPAPVIGPVQVTRAEITAALNAGLAMNRIGTSRYYLSKSGTSVRVHFGSTGDSIGHVTGGKDGDTGKVETIEVSGAHRGKGLGRLLAVAFYEDMVNQGCAFVSLGTPDTSGGFWDKQGVQQAAKTAIATAQGRGGNQQFNIG